MFSGGGSFYPEVLPKNILHWSIILIQVFLVFFKLTDQYREFRSWYKKNLQAGFWIIMHKTCVCPWAADSEDIIGRSFSSSCTLTLPKASWQGSWGNSENFSGFRENDDLQLSLSLQIVCKCNVSHIRKARLVQNITFLEAAVKNEMWIPPCLWTTGAQIWDPRENGQQPSSGMGHFWAVLSKGEHMKWGYHEGPICLSPDNLGISHVAFLMQFPNTGTNAVTMEDMTMEGGDKG